MKQVFRRLAFLLVLLAVLLSVCYMLWPHSFADLQPECDSVTILRSDTAEDYLGHFSPLSTMSTKKSKKK